MNTTLNWEKLYNEGRCKNIGVMWSDEERKAIHTYKIPVDYVRMGIITLDDYKKQLQKEADTGKKPLGRWEMKDLLAKATELSISVAPNVAKSVLVNEIEKRTAIKESQAKQQEALAKAYKIQEKEEAEAKAKAAREVEEARKKMEQDDAIEASKLQAEAGQKKDK